MTQYKTVCFSLDNESIKYLKLLAKKNKTNNASSTLRQLLKMAWDAEIENVKDQKKVQKLLVA
jgi:hypothetical protein